LPKRLSSVTKHANVGAAAPPTTSTPTEPVQSFALERANLKSLNAKFNATRKDFQERRKARTKKINDKRKQSSNSNNISTILSTVAYQRRY
jgi:hypothetical protein